MSGRTTITAVHFKPIRVGQIELANRIIMAPMTRSRADDAGEQHAYVAEYYRQRASAGLIITEATNISPMAKGYIRTPGIYTAEQIEAWRGSRMPSTRRVARSSCRSLTPDASLFPTSCPATRSLWRRVRSKPMDRTTRVKAGRTS